MARIKFYDPQRIIVNSAREVLRQEPFPLEPANCDEREGGVYLLYYKGDLELYQEIRSPDASTPIYVGQAIKLGRRFRVHFNTLTEVWDLDPEEFLCRALRFPDDDFNGFALSVERYIIHLLRPWWNRPKFKGFGNNRSRRVGGKASPWDIIHPGRKFALDLERPPEDEAKLQAILAVKEATYIPPVLELFGEGGKELWGSSEE